MTGKKPEKSGHCSCPTDQQYVNPSFEQDVGSAAGGIGNLVAAYNSRRPSGNLTHTNTLENGTGSVSTKDCTTSDSGFCAMHSNSNSTTHRKGHRRQESMYQMTGLYSETNSGDDSSIDLAEDHIGASSAIGSTATTIPMATSNASVLTNNARNLHTKTSSCSDTVIKFLLIVTSKMITTFI